MESTSGDPAARAALDALRVLTDADRAAILAHVAALVALPARRRAAILALTDADPDE